MSSFNSSMIHQVTSLASAVLWLPIARPGENLSYPFRLWCTFEAAVVAQRELPVYAVGEPARRFERWLMQAVGFAPALPGLARVFDVRADLAPTCGPRAAARRADNLDGAASGAPP